MDDELAGDREPRRLLGVANAAGCGVTGAGTTSHPPSTASQPSSADDAAAAVVTATADPVADVAPAELAGEPEPSRRARSRRPAEPASRLGTAGPGLAVEGVAA